nr:hypothetical protein [Tanacetum cinerariifolium]
HASLILEDFDPPLYELPFHKEVPGSKNLLSFSSENEEKVFKSGILTSKGVHSSLLPELSHRGPKVFKVIKILESPMEIFPCTFGEDIRNDDLPFDIDSDLREIEYLLNHDPIKEIDSILKDSIDESNLAEPNDNLFNTILEMFTDEHALDYSSPPLYDEYDDDLDKFESDIDVAYNDPFDSKGEKIKESKLLIDELDLPRLSDFLPSIEYDSFLFDDFSKVDALPSTNNEEKIAISHASLILEDFDPPLYELPFHKEVPGSKNLLSFSSENEEKVFKSGILTSKGVHSSLLPELSHRGPKVFKVIKILESPMEIFPCTFGEDIRILDVSCLHFYPHERINSRVRSS